MEFLSEIQREDVTLFSLIVQIPILDIEDFQYETDGKRQNSKRKKKKIFC